MYAACGSWSFVSAYHAGSPSVGMNFRAFFVTAVGWGTTLRREPSRCTVTLAVAWGPAQDAAKVNPSAGERNDVMPSLPQLHAMIVRQPEIEVDTELAG